MKCTKIILLLLLMCIPFTAGCFLLDERPVVTTLSPTVEATTIPTTTSGLATREPADMALQLTDLPAGYIIQERADIAYPDISPVARDQGWKKGYYVSFYRMNAEKYDITAISQRIGVYQVDNVHFTDRTMGTVFDAAEAEVLEMANATVSVTELPFPKTGDRTGAYRITDANDPYGIMKYIVLFTNENVFERVEMRGTTTDSEVLKSLVLKADTKIR